MERNQFIDLLFARAEQEGFAACEVYASEAESFSVTVFGGEIDEYNVCSEGGLSFRGLYNGRMGYASTEVLDEDAVEMLVLSARENASLSGFAGGNVRWIVDDCVKFVERELRRGNTYDGIITRKFYIK